MESRVLPSGQTARSFPDGPDLAPEVPRLARCGHSGPEGVRPPCPPLPGPQVATLCPGGNPGLSR